MATSNSKSNKLSAEQIKDIVMDSLRPGDTIHISKKSRNPIINAKATFKGAYNHFLKIEALVNSVCSLSFTISYTDLYTGDTVIHELAEKLRVAEIAINCE